MTTNDNTTATTEQARKVVELLRDATITMLTSIGESGLQAHPMTIQKVEDNADLWFFVPASSEQAANVRDDQRVNVAVAATDVWVSVAGRATLVQDRAKIEELWDDGVGAYFSGKDDPEVALLRVATDTAEYWDTPGGKLTAAASVLRAKFAGEKPKGENEETTLPN